MIARRSFIVLTLMAFANTSCYQGYSVLKTGIDTRPITSKPATGHLTPVYLSGVDFNLSSYGRVERPEWPGLMMGALKSQLEKSQAFSSVTIEKPKAPYLEIQIVNQTVYSENNTTNQSNAFLLAFTFFILSPILRFKHTLESHYQLKVIGPSGVTKQYAEVCSAEYHGTYYTRMAQAEVAFNEINQSCLVSLTHSLLKDVDLLVKTTQPR